MKKAWLSFVLLFGVGHSGSAQQSSDSSRDELDCANGLDCAQGASRLQDRIKEAREKLVTEEVTAKNQHDTEWAWERDYDDLAQLVEKNSLLTTEGKQLTGIELLRLLNDVKRRHYCTRYRGRPEDVNPLHGSWCNLNGSFGYHSTIVRGADKGINRDLVSPEALGFFKPLAWVNIGDRFYVVDDTPVAVYDLTKDKRERFSVDDGSGVRPMTPVEREALIRIVEEALLTDDISIKNRLLGPRIAAILYKHMLIDNRTIDNENLERMKQIEKKFFLQSGDKIFFDFD